MLLLAGVFLTSPSQASPTHFEEGTLQPPDYDYSRLKDVSEEVIIEVSQKILVIKVDNSALIDVEVEDMVEAEEKEEAKKKSEGAVRQAEEDEKKEAEEKEIERQAKEKAHQ